MAAPAQPQQKKTLLMTEGSIWKSILLFSVPLILGNLLQQLYNTADSIIVGNFLGSNALAAVGSSGSPIYLLIGFSQGVAVGAGVVVSQYLGAKDKKETRIAVHTSLAIAVILGLILTVGGIAVSRSLLVWMNTPEEVLGDAVTYMKLYFGGVLFSVVYNMAAGILNAAGNSRRSVIYLACASITNIILDLVLIAGLKMGVAGAAVSTVISKAVGLTLACITLKRKCTVRFSLQYLHPFPAKTFRALLGIALPSGTEALSYNVSQTFILRFINLMGAAVVSAKVYGSMLANVAYVYSIAVGQATQIILGYMIGGRKLDEVSGRVWSTIRIALAASELLTLLILIFCDPIYSIFTDDPVIHALGRQILYVEFGLEIGRSINIVMTRCLTTAGDVWYPVGVGIFSMWVVAVGGSWLLGHALSWGLVGIWIAMACDECLRGALFTIRFRSGKWKETRLVSDSTKGT